MKDKNIKSGFEEIEKKWVMIWEKEGWYQARDESAKKKKYVLVEFPYPSGEGLHIGHAFTMTGADVYARKKRMEGNEVMFPMGWDAFGLPTANYAIKTGKKPQMVTKENTDTFKKQMKKMAFSFDWEREVNTTDPAYYKWTQWIFIKLFERGLAFKEEKPINWCPSCKTGLANEEVVDGKCERCGNDQVSKRNISQWVVKITEYADRLIEGLKETDFIEKVKAAQINWIGKSSGARVTFKLGSKGFEKEEIEVFTTRPDTLWGATFMVLAPEHRLVSVLNKKEVSDYALKARGKSDLQRAELAKEKTGVDTGLVAINPVNGKKIPIWVSDFVLTSYGTGAIMSVPAHDQRDWDFAKKFGLPVIPVVDEGENWDYERGSCEQVNKGKMINSDFINGMEPKEAMEKTIEWLSKKGVGREAVSYHLRDWIFSRQHYWGEPIPMIKCSKCGWVPVPEDQLPVVLPEVEAYEPIDTGESPLAKIRDWVEVDCPSCGGKAERETDTMPNWAGSDWYFLRYADPKNDKSLADMDKLKKWMPVDVYIGGDEHNTLHLLYSRFIYQFLHDIGVVPKEYPEPYAKRVSHGVILGPDGQRMSKSRGNVIIPDKLYEEHGVDALRVYLMFIGPFDGVMAWNERALKGVRRFLERFEKLISKDKLAEVSSQEVKVLVNRTVKKVSEGLDNFSFNTGVAALMELLNGLEKKKEELGQEEAKSLVKLLAVYAPYLSEELWERLGAEGSVHWSVWPKWEEKYLRLEKMEIPVSVNGKVRGRIEVESGQVDDEKVVLKMAKEEETVKEWLKDKKVVKEFYVAGRMVNLVVK
jgi:leucyl-tRNA synthetase